MLRKELLDIVLAAAQILILITLVVYLIKTWRIASVTRSATDMFALSLQVMKETRDIEIAPYLIAYFDLPHNEQNIYLVIKNIGRSPAKDVRLQISPDLKGSKGDDLIHLPALKEGITMMAPGQEQRIFVDSAASFFFEKTDPIFIYNIKLTFYGGLNEAQRVFEQVLDLTSEKKASKSAQRDIRTLNSEVEKISVNIERLVKELTRLNENLSGGIQIRNQTAPAPLPSEDSSWNNIISSKLLEFKNLWSTLYGGNREKLFHPFLGKLKNRLSYITDQLLATISFAPKDTEGELKDFLLDIVAKLADLNSIRIYPDDPQSISRFNSSGDKILGAIEEAMVKIKMAYKDR